MSFAMPQTSKDSNTQESISMTIYSSDKAVPYVYICTHKDTNQFYIGYREKNVKLNIPSHIDLPEYKTSSKKVRPDFHDYTWTIVAEFFDPNHAYTFEQQLICDNWENPLLLNGYYNLGKNQFRTSGPSPRKGIPRSAETKKKISDALKGKPSSKKGKPSPSKGILTGKQRNPSSKPSSKKGKPSGRKGIPTKKKGKPSGKQRNPSGKPSPLKGRPSPSKGKPSGKKGIPNGKQKNPAPEVECPHCGLVGRGGGMTRYHFDNCKMKPT